MNKTIERLHKRHAELCDKAIEALEQGKIAEYEKFKAESNAILKMISDLLQQRNPA